MESGSRHEHGPRAVGLLALHDREFFERLLDDPRRAIEDEKRLDVSPEGIEEVQELIERAKATADRKSALAAWDRFHETGTWDGREWLGSWGP